MRHLSYDHIIASHPTWIGSVRGSQWSLHEHPTLGDEAPLIAINRTRCSAIQTDEWDRPESREDCDELAARLLHFDRTGRTGD